MIYAYLVAPSTSGAAAYSAASASQRRAPRVLFGRELGDGIQELQHNHVSADVHRQRLWACGLMAKAHASGSCGAQ